MKKDELYKEHLAEMFGHNIIDDYSDDDILRVFNRLLECMPNDGKLYKYRSIEGQSFDDAFDSLKNGYIWLSTADQFNDDEDCTLYYNPESEVEALKEYLYQNADLVVEFLANYIRFGKYDGIPVNIADVLDCYDKDTGRIKKKKALHYFEKHGYDRKTSETFINKVQQMTDECLARNSECIKSIANEFLHFNEKNRSRSYIYSLSESFDAPNMWGLYANSNRGFCIEYDFKKAQNLSVDVCRKLISTYKVVYKKEKEPFSFVNSLNYILREKKDDENFKKLKYEMLVMLITKRAEWENEKEWRIYLYDYVNRFNADIVSGIIIDERIITEENAQKLINLCKERNWNITVRTRNITQTKHNYISYADYIYKEIKE